MSEEKSYYYDDISDRAADAGLYDDFEGASTGGRRSGDGGKPHKKHRKKYRRKKKDDSAAKRGKGQKPRNTKKRVIKTLIIVAVCLALLALCGYMLAKQFVKEKCEQVDRVEVSTEDWGIDPRVQEELKDYKNIVLLGVDTREALGETSDSGVRSDAIIIVTINKKTGDLRLTSVMRDSYLDLEEGDTHIVDKVTHAHAYGGPVDTVRALNRNLDLNIDDFIRVDWRAVAEVTDAMGGLPVTVDEGEIDELNKCIQGTNSNLHISYKQVDHVGNQTLNGVQIVAYCRIRMNDGDQQRTDRMREVIVSAMEKAKTMKLSELNNVINLGMSKVTTSMSADTMFEMLMDLSKYSMGESKSWPYDWEGTLIRGIAYDVPVTLKSNVVKLHEDLFGQKDYQPTDNVLMINEEVKMESQYYGGEEADYDLLQRYLDTFGGGPYAGQPGDTSAPAQEETYDDGSYTTDDGGGYTEDTGGYTTEDTGGYTEDTGGGSTDSGGDAGGGDTGGGEPIDSGGDTGGGDTGGGTDESGGSNPESDQGI